jgi:hypothetical protein
MAKDPAFLFYDGDAARDVSHMNRLERGCYFDLIQAQRKFGGFTVEQARKILGKDFDSCWDAMTLILSNENEVFFIEWVKESIANRKEHAEKQRKRIQDYWDRKKKTDEPRRDHGNTVVKPLVNEDENENENENEVEIIKEESEEKKPQKEGKTDFIDCVISKFQEAYREINGIQYEITNKGKERSATGKLIRIFKERYPDSKTEDTLESMKTYFDACVSIDDNWLRKNMSFPIILQQFNQINNILRNGNKKGAGVTNTELATIIAKHFVNG